MHRECRDDGADTASPSVRAAVGPVDTSPDVRVGVSALPSGGSRDGDVGSGQGTAADGLASDARGALSDRRPRAPRAATREHGRPAGCAATGEGTEPADPVWQSRGVCCRPAVRSEEHTSELQSLTNLVCRLLLEKKNEVKVFMGYERRSYDIERSHVTPDAVTLKFAQAGEKMVAVLYTHTAGLHRAEPEDDATEI